MFPEGYTQLTREEAEQSYDEGNVITCFYSELIGKPPSGFTPFDISFAENDSTFNETLEMINIYKEEELGQVLFYIKNDEE